jgi:hypothetical protein
MEQSIYSSSSYIKVSGSLWGHSLADVLSPFQTLCNSIGRALANNCAIASGPIVEISEDRFPKGFDDSIYPWKVFKSTDNLMSGAPALRFYQPSLVASQLTQVLDYFSKMADQYSIPAYAHGDLQVGGAGNTASGLQMLMTSANRVVKNSIKNFDKLIEDSITKLYRYNMITNADIPVGDVIVVAKGSSSLLQRENQVVRRNEFLDKTNNPNDMQILGTEGRRELLYEVAKTIEFQNVDNIIKETIPIEEDFMRAKQAIEMLQQGQMFGMQGATPGANSENIDAAGNTQGGTDRLLNQQQVEQTRTV